MTILNIYGNEYKLHYNVWASAQISKMMPNGKLEELENYLSMEHPEYQLFERFANLAVVLNKAGIMTENFESGLPMAEWPHKEPLSVDMVLSLPAQEFIDIQNNIVSEILEGGKRTIELQPEKNAQSEAEE